ncbi:hypothetical protein AC1031_003947 [Aphanomyces cochlioides]|nr:hypothetical protein AC1031_003947 [Aphanomyces cochlioides]
MAKPRVRILCLHGSRTNADIISMQVGGFRQAFGNSAEFVWFNSPRPASGRPQQPIIDFFGEEGPYYEWWTPFERNRTSYPEWRETLPYVQNYVQQNGPFDVVIGFSQGAAMATLLTAHYQAKGQKIPYKAVILVCGLCPREGMPEELRIEPGVQKFGPLKIPSFHIIGEKDEIFDLGQELIDSYVESSRFVHIHPDDHRFPSPATNRALYKDIVERIQRIAALSEF